MDDVPLVLGGHSFIEELGTDPAADELTRTAVVEACFAAGVTAFDTTYEPERVRLGTALDHLGRHDDATVLAWNFFGEALADPRAYRPGDVEAMADQLGVGTIDDLVVHPVADDAAQARQESLAREWRDAGLVERLGTWRPDPATLAGEHPYDFVVTPYNVTTGEDVDATVAAASEAGLEVLATSPFVRGRELDALTEAAAELEDAREDESRRRVADHLLRYAAFADGVDRVIVACRHPDYVPQNVASVGRGPLDDAERSWLRDVRERRRAE